MIKLNEYFKENFPQGVELNKNAKLIKLYGLVSLFDDKHSVFLKVSKLNKCKFYKIKNLSFNNYNDEYKEIFLEEIQYNNDFSYVTLKNNINITDESKMILYNILEVYHFQLKEDFEKRKKQKNSYSYCSNSGGKLFYMSNTGVSLGEFLDSSLPSSSLSPVEQVFDDGEIDNDFVTNNYGW